MRRRLFLIAFLCIVTVMVITTVHVEGNDIDSVSSNNYADLTGASSFLLDRAVVRLDNGNAAIIDTQGQIIKEFPAGYGAPFFIADWTDGLLRISNDGDRYSAIGYYSIEDGSLVIDHQFYTAGPFVDGYAVVSQRTGNGVINKQGEFVIEPQYNFMAYMGEERFYANTYSGTRCLLDLDGNQLLQVPGATPHFQPFAYGLSSYYNNSTGETSIFNVDGEILVTLEADKAAVIQSAEVANIERNGQTVYLSIRDGELFWEDDQKHYSIGAGVEMRINQYVNIPKNYQPYVDPYERIYYPVLSGYKDEQLEAHINQELYDFFIWHRPETEYEIMYKVGEVITHVEGHVGSFTKESRYGVIDMESNWNSVTLNMDLATGRVYTLGDLLLPGVEKELEEHTLPIENTTEFALIDGGLRFYQIIPGFRAIDPGRILSVVVDFDEIDNLINKNSDFWLALTKGSMENANRAALPFPDMPASHWAYAYTKSVFEAGIMQGDGKNFMPNDAILYEQAAAVFSRLLLESTGEHLQRADRDPNEPWYVAELESAERLGILEGLEGMEIGTTMRRDDLMVMLANVLKKKGLVKSMSTAEVNEVLSRFQDEGDIPDFKRDSAAMSVQAGFITGAGNLILPNETYTRAQAAKILTLIHQEKIDNIENQIKK
ncbi:S-layer homology domain-containing protein [Desulfuribacillus alkaliarsenatis]|uniref:SLH domain-containing protein n=1 Tax=Desulfuribacillus alkaliarsenatis TaxID=766136 RepID=A0A1E5G044_9FIRM|nr:S-layer homology domain-containing protein [Desulfuribacillus alkaliarsenatis]OEF96113.1 hypothetical protein BHF68_10300 [Desulfuribacillus alkaliarsenatis]